MNLGAGSTSSGRRVTPSTEAWKGQPVPRESATRSSPQGSNHQPVCDCFGVASTDEMSQSTFYHTSIWRKLSREAKERDKCQCQTCGDRPGDPYCQLHAHHRVPRSKGGPDTVQNLDTLCDLCHAVVTKRWHKPWFGEGALWGRDLLRQARENYMWFLSLDPQERARVQTAIWSAFGVLRPTQQVINIFNAVGSA
jgi:5-methylcytosine-specific restriction endonuclease McrA